MSLKALFVADAYVLNAGGQTSNAATACSSSGGNTRREVIQGFTCGMKGYSGWGDPGRFSYQPTRQTLEMTTYYRRSVAVDQMRMVAPDLRLRHYHQCPTAGEHPVLLTCWLWGRAQAISKR